MLGYLKHCMWPHHPLISHITEVEEGKFGLAFGLRKAEIADSDRFWSGSQSLSFSVDDSLQQQVGKYSVHAVEACKF